MLVLAGKVRKVVLQEHQADDVLEQLDVRVSLQALFPKQDLHARDRRLVILNLAENLTGSLRVKLRKISAPPAIAVSTLRVLTTWDRPPLDVLAAGGQANGFGCVGCDPIQARRHSLSVHDLLGPLEIAYPLTIGVLTVCRVETVDRPCESRPRTPSSRVSQEAFFSWR